MLEKFGVSGETMGCRNTFVHETVQFNAENSAPVYYDKTAYESDDVIIINRVKPHTVYGNK